MTAPSSKLIPVKGSLTDTHRIAQWARTRGLTTWRMKDLSEADVAKLDCDYLFSITWLQIMPTTSPAARSHHALAYDRTRERVVLFGGFDGTDSLADTWEWNGVDWTQGSPMTAPVARRLHAMDYDQLNGEVVLFGGLDNNVSMSDKAHQEAGHHQRIFQVINFFHQRRCELTAAVHMFRRSCLVPHIPFVKAEVVAFCKPVSLSNVPTTRINCHDLLVD